MDCTSAVQRLYEMCKQTFSPDGVVPPEPAIARLKSLLDTIKPEDVGIEETEMLKAENEGSYSYLRGPAKRRKLTRISAVVERPQWPPPVKYVHVHECDSFSIGIFCLPRSATIPLHNHPGMTVLSKVLYGSMHVTAYDWYDHLTTKIRDQHSHPSQEFRGMRLAKLKVDSVLTGSSESNVLYPTRGGNIHSFRAGTSCAVLDVLSPPYDDGDPSYYRVSPYSGLSLKWKEETEWRDEQHCVWLEQVDRPKSFRVSGQMYLGPVVQAV